MIVWFGNETVPRLTTVLCDADGTLFPSEEPAYVASAEVTNRFLAHLGADTWYEPPQLQALTNGQNFRSASGTLAALHDKQLDDGDLERWVAEEKDQVTSYLRTVLEPDVAVSVPIARLAESYSLAVVTSSASTRLAACLDVTGLSEAFDPHRCFSAENSLARPISKPDPAVYTFACRQLGVEPEECVAVEDSVNGASSAVAAGCWTLGTIQFVPAEQRAARVEALRAAGVAAVVDTWWDVVDLLSGANA
jgi:HAD superfamily hydrolase (TIGR01509 family)